MRVRPREGLRERDKERESRGMGKNRQSKGKLAGWLVVYGVSGEEVQACMYKEVEEVEEVVQVELELLQECGRCRQTGWRTGRCMVWRCGLMDIQMTSGTFEPWNGPGWSGLSAPAPGQQQL